MATSVDLPENLEWLIESEVERGNYRSKSEVIRDAIRRMFEASGRIEQKRLSDEAREGIREARSSDEWIPHEEVVEQHS